MNNNQIIPECWADTLLVKILGFGLTNHQGGIGQVLSVLSKNFKNRQAVGIIDNDKIKPKDLDLYVLSDHRAEIRKMVKPGSKHTLLLISPAFEDWVFEHAKAAGVDPESYGFRTRKYFRDTCKDQDVDKNDRVKQFLNTLKQKSPGFQLLKTWICEGAGIDETDL